MTSEKGSRRDKNQNIQVFVRLRPLNQRERDIKSLGVIEVVNGREVVVRTHQSIHTKKFTFDQAFGPHAKQVEVYQHVVSPLIEEVLCGYNCTVFAYGQTGTGKTHTMVGESTGDESNWQSDPLAGIIPRALSQLFDELRISNTEYTVRVSYLELYNEELFDLLSSSEDNSKLRIYEDVTRKGANIVNGLEEITVYNKNEVYKIMAQGQERKKVASTLMNAQSSRSHTVFTIVVHMKENSPEGEELVKIGKLNLVDLAGSENISKAGSDNPARRERARECVNINQSLLTLGRVITALVERHPHIPYRESKLTRILQESLGGRTKTSIIATISPGHKDIEETMSTLEYANRAKNIQNKPEINQKMTKKAILKEFAEEIDKLKRDLQAARDKNGVYLANETFAEMSLKDEEQRKEIQELLLKKRAMEEDRDRMEAVFAEVRDALRERVDELGDTKRAVESAREQLADTQNLLQSTKRQFEEQRHLVGEHRATEAALSAQAQHIIAVADTAAEHVSYLHASVDKRRTVESSNLQVTQAYRRQAAELRDEMAARVSHLVDALSAAILSAHEQTDKYTASSTQTLEENQQTLQELAQKITEAVDEVKSSCSLAHSSLSEDTGRRRESLRGAARALSQAARAALEACGARAGAARRLAADTRLPATVRALVDRWLPDALSRAAALGRAHAAHRAAALQASRRHAEACARRRDARRRRLAAAAARAHAALAELEAEKSLLEERLTKQLSDIERERRDTASRLAQWMEEERKLLEERLARHAAAETEALERRLAERTADVQAQRDAVEQRVECIEAWRLEQMAAVEEENKMADAELAECQAGREQGLACDDRFGKELVEGVTAMSADLEAFSGNVVQVTEYLSGELLRLITEATEEIERESSTAIASTEQAGAQLAVQTDAALDGALAGAGAALHAVAHTVETSSAATISSLSALAASECSLAAAARALLAASEADTRRAQHAAGQLADDVAAASARQQALEAGALGEHFRVYSPTGKTPARQEYRVPRALAATSPYERILARFRAMRHRDDECVVVEPGSDGESGESGESSASEDSALAPPTPSPPALPSPPAPPSPLAPAADPDKHTYYRKPAGKENPRCAPPKASRLPAPASHKKPLLQRNDCAT